MKQKKFRSHYVLNPKLQIAMVIIPVVIYTISLVIAFVFLSNYYQDSFDKFTRAGMTIGHPVFEYLSLQKEKIYLIIGVSLLLGFILNTLVMIWVTHKVVGPIYRLKVSMQAMLKNEELREIKLRKGDFFKEEAELLEKIRVRGIK